MKHFQYKGYLGSAEVDVEDGLLVGRLLFLRDVVSYSATSVAGLEAAFKAAVDDYLETCRELGDEPDVPCKGTFNVRVGPERHRQAAIEARRKDIGLNEFVCLALDSILASPRTVNHVHTLQLIVSNDGEGVATTSQRKSGVVTTAVGLNWAGSKILENFGGNESVN